MADSSEPFFWELLQRAADDVDPVPTHVTEAAGAALDLVGALSRAELVFDSAEDGVTAMRADDEHLPRVIEFAAPSCVIELTVATDGDPPVSGQIDPATGSALVVEAPGGELARVETTDGAFVLTSVPGGPVRIVVIDGEERLLATSWVLLA